MIVFGITDKGKVRRINQDSFRQYIAEDGSVAVVVLCDGMGGGKCGEVASAIASQAFEERALALLAENGERELAEVARKAAAYANEQVYNRSYRDESCAGMGTTLVAAIVRGANAAVVNIGDSRCYWLADGSILQVTRDHSMVQELVDKGLLTAGEARVHPRKNIIMRALGIESTIRSDVFRLELKAGDTLLLCSDGLSNLFLEEELRERLDSPATIEEIGRGLMAEALQRGAPDNVTVLLMRGTQDTVGVQ